MFSTSLRTSLCLALLLPAAVASAQSGVFDIVSKDKVIGHTSYTLDKAKDGFRLKSKYAYKLNGMDTSVADDFRLSADYAYVDGSASNQVTQMHTAYTPNKARTTLVIAQMQGGVQESHNLAIKPNLAVVPSYDAGAAQVMLLLATTHPSADNQYNVMVPAAAAAGAPTTKDDPGAAQVPGGNNAYDSLWTKGADATGTLDGKPVTVHSYTLAAARNKIVLYADDANLLMQVDAPLLRASYIRAKFKLDTPAAP